MSPNNLILLILNEPTSLHNYDYIVSIKKAFNQMTIKITILLYYTRSTLVIIFGDF